MREAAITEARAAAEREARETLNAELARVRSETEVTVADALNKVKVEAEEAERVRVEAERMRAEAQEAFAAELARVRAEVEQKLTVQLEAARTEAERMRAAEAAASPRARSGRSTTQVRARTPSICVRAGAQGRRVGDTKGGRADQASRRRARHAFARKPKSGRLAELDEIKAQMAELREAAAQHVGTPPQKRWRPKSRAPAHRRRRVHSSPPSHAKSAKRREATIARSAPKADRRRSSLSFPLVKSRTRRRIAGRRRRTTQPRLSQSLAADSRSRGGRRGAG